MRASRLPLPPLPLLLLALLSLGHGEGSCGGGGAGAEDDAHGPHGAHAHAASGATCPPLGAPTAQAFGEAFLDRYCRACHGAGVQGQARAGAPEGVDFDTPEAVRRWAAAIDAHAAAGPAGHRDAMPPAGSPLPTHEERERLGQWLACGAP
jgi:uncharacterized membrane protein